MRHEYYLLVVLVGCLSTLLVNTACSVERQPTYQMPSARPNQTDSCEGLPMSERLQCFYRSHPRGAAVPSLPSEEYDRAVYLADVHCMEGMD